MNIRKLGLNDTQKLLDYLKPVQTECLFIYSNLHIAGIDYQGKDFQGEYFAAFNDDETIILGVIVLYWNGNIMMHASSHLILEELCEHFKKHTYRPIAGVIGLEMQAHQIIKNFKLDDQQFRINHSEGLFELNYNDLKTNPLPENMKMIELKDAPKNIIIEWMQAYDIEALGAEMSDNLLTQAESKYQQMLKQGAWILKKDDIPVSICGFNARVEQTCQLGPVWTPPEHRNKGYAKYCVGHALLQEQERGYHTFILFTNNPAAEKVYITLGFKKFNRFCLALLKTMVCLK